MDKKSSINKSRNKRICTENQIVDTHEIKNGIEKLDDESLRKIFRYLTNSERIKVERVCKRWKVLSMSSWNNFTQFTTDFFDDIIENFETKFVKQIFSSFITRGGVFIKKLDMNYVSDSISPDDSDSDEEVEQISEEENAYSNWKLIFNCVAKFCENIEEIIISKFGNTLQYLDEFLKPIFSRNQNIKSITLERIKISGECLLSLPFKSIEVFSFGSYLDIWMKPEYLSAAFKKLKNLKKCHIRCCYSQIELILKEIATIKNDILHLSIKSTEFCSGFGVEAPKFSKYFARLKKLKEIELNSMKLYSNDLTKLPKNSIERMVLNPLYIFDDSDNRFIDKHLPLFVNLKHVEFRDCQLVNNKLSKALVKFSNLESINLNFCKYLSERALLDIAEISSLKKFSIERAPHFTDVCLNNLINLKELKFSKCPNITSDGLCNFLKKAHNLEKISASEIYIFRNILDTAFDSARSFNKRIINLEKGKKFISYGLEDFEFDEFSDYRYDSDYY